MKTAKTADLAFPGEVDVVVVGSGLGGMIAAIRSHDLGLRTILVEKCHYYGGTSALSGGGVWIPNHSDMAEGEDSREKSLSYLESVMGGKADRKKLEAYVDQGRPMIEYARSLGMGILKAETYPDYFSDNPDAVMGRTLLAADFDGQLLGEEFFRMRMTYPSFLAFDRYSMNLKAVYSLLNRQSGWLMDGFKLVAGYWADISWRRKTPLDSRLSMGRALVGSLRRAMMERGIPLFLNAPLVEIESGKTGVKSVKVRRNGNLHTIECRALVLASGGFEQNQEMRDKYHAMPTQVASSLTPDGANEGDGILAGQAVGAAVDNMDQAWWVPTIRLPGDKNTQRSAQVFFDRGRPGVVCVNRLGNRFCDEGISYDQFGHAMMDDHRRTGANLPCWMIFDARYRRNYPASDLLPAWIRPDSKLPPEYWDNVIYRADSVEELARKIEVDAGNLASTIEKMNAYAKTGRDLEFNRGESDYDKFFGSPANKPNPNLGTIDRRPFYALRMELGDIGTKGGLRVDEFARVLTDKGRPIRGLYATGNTTGSLFLHTYPGAGATLGPAMVFGYVAANHAAGVLTNRTPEFDAIAARA